MDDTRKMFRTIINGQSAMKSELLTEINKHRQETSKGFENVNKKIDEVNKGLTKRIDKLGASLAYLEDDAPTREEFEALEQKVASAN